MRTVPEHLGHLRTDRRGLPVPYINRWGPEDPSRVSIGFDSVVDRQAVMYDDSGFDEPDFTAQHMGRQRECMVRGLCQVCARHVPWRQRNLVLSDMSVHLVDLYGRSRPAVTEPWLCPTCADFATTTCPALIRRQHGSKLQRIALGSRRLRLIHSHGYLDGPLFAESVKVLPTMWVKALLPKDWYTG